MIYGNILLQQMNGHGSEVLMLLINQEYMEHLEFLIVPIFQELDMVQILGLIQWVTFGCLEVRDMILLVFKVLALANNLSIKYLDD